MGITINISGVNYNIFAPLKPLDKSTPQKSI